MKKILKKLMSLFVTLTIVFSISIPAFATEYPSSISDYEDTTMNDILLLKPFVYKNYDGTLSLDIETAKKNGANPMAIEALTYHFTNINPEILKGEISVDDNLNVINFKQRITHSHSIKASSCQGINKFETHWWGYRRYADNCQSKRISSNLNTIAAGGTMSAGVASGIATIFPASAPISGTIAAGLTFDAGYWWLIASRIDANNKGRGTIINMTYLLVFDIEPQ